MMFVRPGDFDQDLVRSFCTAARPHSCGPGAWSLKQDRHSWDARTKAWAAEVAKGWPEVEARERPRGASGRGSGDRGGGRGRRAGRGRGARWLAGGAKGGGG